MRVPADPRRQADVTARREVTPPQAEIHAVRVRCIDQTPAIRRQKRKRGAAGGRHDRLDQSAVRGHTVDLRLFDVEVLRAVIEVNVTPVGGPSRPVDVLCTLSLGHDRFVLPVGIGNDQRIAQGSASSHECDPLSIRRPVQRGIARRQHAARDAAEGRRNDPCGVALPLATPLRDERDFGTVRGNVEAADVVGRLDVDRRCGGEIRRIAAGNELDPHVGRAAGVGEIRDPLAVGRDRRTELVRRRRDEAHHAIEDGR